VEPIKKKKAGRELVNAAAAGEICGVSGETYQWYVRTGRPKGNPPPGHVEVDNATGQRMYPAKAVRAWHDKRPGRGNWGGEGARARQKFREGEQGEQAAVQTAPDAPEAVEVAESAP
jgi:hypothetical protein